MDDSAGVAKIDAIDELEYEEADLVVGDGRFVHGHIFLEVVLGVFKDQVQLLFRRLVDDIFEAAWGKAYFTMFGCGCSSLRIEISRIAVEGTPSSSFSSLIFFKATISFVFLSRARYTTP
jgi:hypothetical protein